MFALPCIVGLCPALFATVAEAKCKVKPGYVEKTVEMAMGEVRIPFDHPKGKLIAMKEFDVPLKGTEEEAVVCDKNGGSVTGEILNARRGSSDIHDTNVPGVGIRLTRIVSNPSGGASEVTYPHTNNYVANSVPTFYSPVRFRVELFKTADHTGSGPLSQGTYTRYAPDGEPGRSVLTTSLGGSGTTIKTPSCEIDASSRNIVVRLKMQPLFQFTQIGPVQGGEAFSIRLNCKAGLNINKVVYLRMNGDTDPSARGVLRPQSGEGSASGVGIQLLDASSQPVDFRQDAIVGPSKDGSYVVSYTARYYQTAGTVQPGVVKATATFTVDHK